LAVITLRFRFAGVHSDAPEPSGDLAHLHRIVADELEVVIGDESVYREVEFPVVELAAALDSWLRNDMPSEREFTFAPTGYAETGALQFRPSDGEWIIDSSLRAASAARLRIAPEDLNESLRRYLDDVSAACATLGIELEGLLERLRKWSGEGK
jgi:hypothetical protein